MVTSELSSLSPAWRTRYRIAQALLVLLFILTVTAFIFVVLFPSQTFTFDFKNPQAAKNTLVDPRSTSGEDLSRGRIPASALLHIDASWLENRSSSLEATFAFDKTPSESNVPRSETLTVTKSYRAFLLPTGDPITARAPEAGPVAPSGFLLSFADGVFLVDGNLIRPIGSAAIFQSLGYTWDDVIPANEETLGAFEKGKMITESALHPDGTVFYATDTHTYFLIQNGAKHPIPDTSIAESYLRGRHPILVSEEGTSKTTSCALTRHGWWTTGASCTAPLENVRTFPGNTYRLSAHFDDEVSLQSANVTLTDALTQDNARLSLTRIKQGILLHYGYAQ